MIFNRLSKNYKHLRKWLRQENIEAFRLYDRDIPEYPFIVDIYKDHALIFERGRKDFDQEGSKKDHPLHIQEAVRDLFSIDKSKIIYKTRQRQKGSSQYTKEQTHKNSTARIFSVHEGPCQYHVNLHDYLDTGLFLDHRPLRRKIRENSQDKNFLNLFCYTGSVSIAAAMGGAQTTNVDLSKTYLNWAQKNFKLNNLSLKNHNFLEKDVRLFLEEENKTSDLYDTVFLDPPTFSNSKKMKDHFDVQKEHADLVNMSMSLLKPDGILYFSTNKRDFRLSLEISQKFNVKDVTQASIPKDFRDPKIHQCYQVTHSKD